MYDDRRFSIILYASKPGVLFFLPTTFLWGNAPSNQAEVELQWSVKKPNLALTESEYFLM